MSSEFTTPEMKPSWKWESCSLQPFSSSGNWSASMSFTEPEVKPLTIVDHIQRVVNGIVEGICGIVKSIADWFNSPQVRRFFKHLSSAMRRVGLIEKSKVPPRRRAVSTKRAMIYQRKALMSIDNP